MRPKAKDKRSPVEKTVEPDPPRNAVHEMTIKLREVCGHHGPITEYAEGITDEELFSGLQEWVDARKDDRWVEAVPRRRVRVPYRLVVSPVEVN
jgi:hypothetical protein